MPFNSDTYYMNKHRRMAWSELGKAREVKARAAAGNAYTWEVERIPHFVRCARISMHLAIGYRRIREIGR